LGCRLAVDTVNAITRPSDLGARATRRVPFEERKRGDPYLHAAILLGLALASRQHRPYDAGDIEALADVQHRIEKELERLDKMRKLAESIRGDAEKLGEEVRKGGDALGVLLRKAKATLKALNVELTEAETAKSAPVMLPAGSLAQARAALGPVAVEGLLAEPIPPADGYAA
jgi:hypothetical protein